MNKRAYIYSLLIALIISPASADLLSIWSDQPAGPWIEAYPIGNGSLGAMVFGGVEQDLIQFNHDTLFNGQPHDYAHEGAVKHLSAIRKLLTEGRQNEAHALANRTFMSVLDDGSNRQRAYQPFGDLHLTFPEFRNMAHIGYRRELDLDRAMVSTEFTVNGTTFRREVFASYPDQVIVIQLTSSRPAGIHCTASLKSPHDGLAFMAEDDHVLRMSGMVKHGVTRFEARLRVRTDGGTVTFNGQNGLDIKGANTATLILAGTSSFINYQDVSGDPAQRTRHILQQIHTKPYAQLQADHIQDHRALFRRVSLDVGSSDRAKLPTTQRLAQFEAGDPQLAELFFQYGRYLMIACSRPGSQPSNLQGLWNDSLKPSWESKYTCNINTEMNYWPAESANLAECHEPLFRALQDLSVSGAKVAKAHYGARGWVVHHNFDLWRGAAPINNANHGIWPTGGAWMCQHLWWHYAYGRDRDFLADTAYPLMKSAALFFVDVLVEHTEPDGTWLISGPSNSPEQGGLVMGPAMDHQIIRSLFGQVIEASRILGVDEELRLELTNLLPRIAPDQTGKHGQLQEWLEDVDNPGNRHRHLSHLWGLYPGKVITREETPRLAEAARTSLEHRGDGSVGWSRAWQVSLYARLGDAENAYDRLSKLIHLNGNPNLFNKCWDNRPLPFQIDGNFGATAGLAEMLLQSHRGEIHLLPALPVAWPAGNVTGLRAQGGYEIDIHWENSKLVSAVVHARKGATCQVRYQGTQRTLDLKPGQTQALFGTRLSTTAH